MLMDAFTFNLRYGISWKHQAKMLREAANKIQEEYLKGYRRNAELLEGKLTPDETAQVFHDLSFFPTYMLLMGYALENCIKGVIICKKLSRDPNCLDAINDIDEITYLKVSGETRKFKRHDLDEMFNAKEAEEANIKITHDEEEVLKHVSSYVKWAGRYPISVKPEDYHTYGLGLDSRKQNLLDKIYTEAIDKLEQLSKDQCLRAIK